MILCGVRDIRDYRIQTSTQEIITGGSAFNIKTESLRVGNFSPSDITELYGQYTAATGQTFAEGVLDTVWELTGGQPWLVNALARELTEKLKPELTQPITLDHLLEAKNRLVVSRVTHPDQLVFRLEEERVRRVIEPLLAGQSRAEDFPRDDIQYLIDLGLIQQGEDGNLEITNGIYREVIPRELTATTEMTLTVPRNTWYCDADKRLDMDKLLASFQDFFRQHAEHWVERFRYKEAGPQLLLQAFLQRIVNGGGRIEREYGAGRGRTDLYLEWLYGANSILKAERRQCIVIEIKLLHQSKAQTLAQGLEQVQAYAQRYAADEMHLILFDRTPDKSCDEKIYRETHSTQQGTVIVWGGVSFIPNGMICRTF